MFDVETTTGLFDFKMAICIILCYKYMELFSLNKLKDVEMLNLAEYTDLGIVPIAFLFWSFCW